MICTTLILAYYNQQKELFNQCDRSQRGFGAVLLQDGQPIDYRSNFLTATETIYYKIGKEFMAVVFFFEESQWLHSWHACTPALGLSATTKDNQLAAKYVTPTFTKDTYMPSKKWYRSDLESGKKLVLADTLSGAQQPERKQTILAWRLFN